MIFYVLFAIALFQLSFLGANLYQLGRKRRSIRKYSEKISRVIPEMKTQPNPLFGELMKTLGEAMNREERDPSWRMLGSILNSYDVLLAENAQRPKNVQRRVVYQPEFIKRAQDMMTELRTAFEQDDKALYADFAFKMSCFLFESFQPEPYEQEYSVSKELGNTLRNMADYLSKRKLRSDVLETTQFRPLDDEQLGKADPYLRFLYFHIIRWCYELPFRYEIYGPSYLKKSRQISNEIKKGLKCAEDKNVVCMYSILSKTYSSLFPRTKLKLSSEEIFKGERNKEWRNVFGRHETVHVPA